MRIVTLVACVLISESGFCDCISNGQYSISFSISDMHFEQEVTITNCTQYKSCAHFDIVVEKAGSLKRYEGSRQIVRGTLCKDRLNFVIPSVKGSGVVDPYIFVADGEAQEKGFFGSGDVVGAGPNGGNNRFKFRMNRINPNQSLDLTADPPRD